MTNDELNDRKAEMLMALRDLLLALSDLAVVARDQIRAAAATDPRGRR